MSVKSGTYSFETLNHKIFAGKTQITKIFAGNTLIYPTRGAGLRCYINIYPKLDYYVGDPFDWTHLQILAEDEFGNTEDVTEHFVLYPASGDHCKHEGPTVVKCVWETDDNKYVLYFTAHGTLLVLDEPKCWIEQLPYKTLYWDHQVCNWDGLIILGVYLDGHIEDVTKYFEANPASGTLHHLTCRMYPPGDNRSSIGKHVQTFTCNLVTYKLGTTKKTVSFDYRYLPRYMHRFDDLLFDPSASYTINKLNSRNTEGRYMVTASIWHTLVLGDSLNAPRIEVWPVNSLVKLNATMLYDSPPEESHMIVLRENPTYVVFEYSATDRRGEPYLHGLFNIDLLDENFREKECLMEHYKLRTRFDYLDLDENGRPKKKWDLTLVDRTRRSSFPVDHNAWADSIPGSFFVPDGMSYSFSRAGAPYVYEILGVND